MTRLITSIRATTSVIKKSCRIQKVAHFTYFDQKNTHISGCKIVHKCTSATITVYICTVTVTLLYIILILFLSSPDSFSLSSTQSPQLSTSANHTDPAPPQLNIAKHHHCNPAPPTIINPNLKKNSSQT